MISLLCIYKGLYHTFVLHKISKSKKNTFHVSFLFSAEAKGKKELLAVFPKSSKRKERKSWETKEAAS